MRRSRILYALGGKYLSRQGLPHTSFQRRALSGKPISQQTLGETAEQVDQIRGLVALTAAEVLAPKLTGLATQKEMNERFDRLESNLTNTTDLKLSDMESRIDKNVILFSSNIDKKFTTLSSEVDQKFTTLSSEIKSLSSEVDQKFTTLSSEMKASATMADIQIGFFKSQRNATRWLMGGGGLLGFALFAERAGFFKSNESDADRRMQTPHANPTVDMPKVSPGRGV